MDTWVLLVLIIDGFSSSGPLVVTDEIDSNERTDFNKQVIGQHFSILNLSGLCTDYDWIQS